MQTDDIRKTGRGRLEQLVAELERQRETKVDFVCDRRTLVLGHDTRDLFVTTNDDRVLEWMTNDMGITRNGLRQFLAKCNPPFPMKFFDNVSDNLHALELATDLFQSQPKRALIRCLDGKVRAVLSDKFRVVDNYDLAFHALDTVRDVGGEVVECRLTDSHMRVAFTTREVHAAIKAGQAGERNEVGWQANHQFKRITGLQWGDYRPPHGAETVHPIVTIRNSETGEGGLEVSRGILETACLNMSLIAKDVSRVHLGGKMEEGVYEAETLEALSRSLLLQCRDVLRKAFDPVWFNTLVQRMQLQADTQLQHPTSAINNLALKYDISEQRREAILDHFMRGGGSNHFSVGRAISRASQDVEADDAQQLEELAGAVMIGDVKLVDKESVR